MVLGCKKGNKQSMSDSNIEVLQKTRKKSPGEIGSNCKECCTFSSQYNASNLPEVTTIVNKIKEEVLPLSNIPLTHVNNRQPCTCPPCSCPPYPYPPQDDLWDLQFSRWWGWNWVRKRDEIVNKQKKAYCTKREKSPCSKKCTKKHKNPKQDDFFSWCNKLFKGRQKECPLKTEEKQQLQDMYDTPSLVTVNKCCQPSFPNWDSRSVNLQRSNKCYSNSGRQTSMSTIFIKNKTRRDVEKCNRRRYQSYLCERGESTSSEECRPRIYQCPKTPLSSTEESVEYLALRMECLNSDNETNFNRYQKRLKCCQPQIFPGHIKKKYPKNVCHCKLKTICEKKDNEPFRRHVKECIKMGDPYNGQFSQWKCKCGRHCTCLKDTPIRYPQFSKLYRKNKCIPEQDQIKKKSRKEYIIHCPLVYCKKRKNYCTCCNNYKAFDCECKYNNCKTMIDKSVSCPDVTKNQTLRKTQIEPFTQNYKIALNSLQDSMATALKNGQFSSPVSGKLYELNPRVVHDTSIPNHNNFLNPIDVNQTFLNFYNDTSEIPSADKEHNVILTAVCEAIMSSRSSDQGSDKVVEEAAVSDFDYLFMDNYRELLNPSNTGNYNRTNNIENYTQKSLQCTDKFIGYHGNNSKPYETIPLKSIEKAGVAGYGIPLLKRKLHESTCLDQGNILKIAKESNSEIISNNLSNFDSDSISKKLKIDLSPCQREETEKSYEYPNTFDNSNTNTVTLRSHWPMVRSSNLPGISINGLFSAISSKFANKNNRQHLQSNLPNTVKDSKRFYSKNSSLTSESTISPTEPCMHSFQSPFIERQAPGNILHEMNQDLHENDFANKNKLCSETLHKYIAQGTSPNLTNYQSDPMSAANLSSPLGSLSNNIDLNVCSLNHSDEVNSNIKLNSLSDLNYLKTVFDSPKQNTQNSSSFVDTQSTKNKYLTISNILQNDQTFSNNPANDLSRVLSIESNTDSFSSNTLCGHEMFEHSINTVKSKDVTTNTGIRKSRIPIHDTIVRDFNILLPIIEEHNIQSPQTRTSSEVDKHPCSKAD